MDKVYNHKDVEEKLYESWEKNGLFSPEINPDGKPYTIILPPPNANGDLHFGHAMFVLEDILIRYHRMKGEAALWLPGTDHAGTETQFVFEKKLQEQGKSRFDFSREDLYKQIWDYVEENKGGIESQLRRLGFSLDWSRKKFTLDPDVVVIVKNTFNKMYKDGLVYRDYRLVNYCTKDGTSFSDLEVVHEDRIDPLYYIKYGPLILATTRPETKFGDTAVAVNPKDERYKKYIGQTLDIETVLGPAKISVIADDYVDPEFGTGVVKITPAHDFNDFEVGKRHNLEMKQVIGFDGKLNHYARKFEGLYVKQARKAIVEEMQEKGLIEKIDENYTHRISLCYKCKTVLEPLPREQWYVKVKPLVDMALKAIDSGYIDVFPKNYLMSLRMWYKNLRDWNISRQNVWGIQMPVWYEIEDAGKFMVSFIDKDNIQHQGSLIQFLNKEISFEEILEGLQQVIAPMEAKVVMDNEKLPTKKYLPETDTFDTWFSSSQWPYVTLKTTKPGDFEKFYPTSVMETGRDILFFWVSRMIMLGLYANDGMDYKEVNDTILEDKVPFKDIVLHGLVNDPLGKKMSKSKGNVVNPLEVADEYGADAVRFALVYGTALGNDQAMSYQKLEAMRRFTNKLWNMARFFEYQKEKYPNLKDEILDMTHLKEKIGDTYGTDESLINAVGQLVEEITKYIDSYQFNLAAERLYEFIWHEFADFYIEQMKEKMEEENYRQDFYTIYKSCFFIQLKLLHPFMPFVTDSLYLSLHGDKKSIMIESWPYEGQDDSKKKVL